MAKSFCDGGAPFFSGDLDNLKAFASWLDDVERAAVCRVATEDDNSFVVDLRALNKALAVGAESLSCLNPVDAQRLCGLVGELQRDVAALLAGGLEAFLEPSAAQQQQQLDMQLRQTIHSATPYLRWLGVRVRDELVSYTNTDAGEPVAPAKTRTDGAGNNPSESGTGKGKAQPGEQPEPAKLIGDVAHSIDFRSVLWFGEKYTFTANQAACVKVLWENWEQGTPQIGEQTILVAAGSVQDRLIGLFKHGNHPAWGSMIRKGSNKGTFFLCAQD